LVDLESRNEGEDGLSNLESDGILRLSGFVKSGRDLRVQVDDVVEPVEKAGNGYRDALDPCSGAGAEREGEDLDDAAKTVDERPLRLAKLPDHFLTAHLKRTEAERKAFVLRVAERGAPCPTGVWGGGEGGSSGRSE
jgi:hypothetical protein